jgi:hypothetical protein
MCSNLNRIHDSVGKALRTANQDRLIANSHPRLYTLTAFAVWSNVSQSGIWTESFLCFEKHYCVCVHVCPAKKLWTTVLKSFWNIISVGWWRWWSWWRRWQNNGHSLVYIYKFSVFKLSNFEMYHRLGILNLWLYSGRSLYSHNKI